MHAELLSGPRLAPSELALLWQQLIADPGSPERFELSEHGEMISSPSPTNHHQLLVASLQEQLRDQLGGRAVAELAVSTSAGVRKPDAAWLPEDLLALAQTSPMATCPPLVAEVLSPGNRESEVAHKVEAYLTAGAKEVIVIDLRERMRFHRTDGVHLDSAFGLRLRFGTAD